MKRPFFILLLLFFVAGFSSSAFGQAPARFNYQAAVRDGGGNLLTNQAVSIRITIRSGSPSGSVVFQETHGVSSNAFGLVNLAIGSGSNISGSLGSVAWGAAAHFISVELDPAGGSNYVLMGAQQLLSTPYALYANSSGNVNDADADPNNELQSLSVSNDTVFLSNGGFAVLPGDGDSDASNELQSLSISNDTVYLSNGGFVVLPADSVTSVSGLSDTDDDTKVQVEESADEDIIRFDLAGAEKWAMVGDRLSFTGGGGNLFVGSSVAVNNSGVSNTGLGANALASITSASDNVAVGTGALSSTSSTGALTAVGVRALRSNTSGSNNAAFGYNSLFSNTSGGYNVAVGHSALRFNTTSSNGTALGANALSANTTGEANTAVGASALASNTIGASNVAVGWGALTANTSGVRNVGIGQFALGKNTTGQLNIGIGINSLHEKTTGSRNIGVGGEALFASSTGENNLALGFQSLFRNTSGSNNVVLGHAAGANNLTGSGNVFIGANSGAQETGSDRLYIDNSNSSSPLIYGQFDQDVAVINGDLGIGAVPGSTGLAMMELYGPQASFDGPHIQAVTPVDSFPVFQQLNWTHDNISLNFDAYYDGSWRSADPTSNYQIYKLNHLLAFQYVSHAPAGSAIVWQPALMIDTLGRIGVGGGPTGQGLVTINGSTSHALGPYGYLNNSGTTMSNPGVATVNYSLFATDRIAATEFNAFSDSRIKRVLGVSDGAADLGTLMALDVTDYKLIDSIGAGNGAYKKLIAQQVKAVFPQAVDSTIRQVVPDIYALASIADGRVALEQDLAVGDAVKLIFADREEVVVVEAADAAGFQVDLPDSGAVFVFGRFVDDFHAVDYEAIGMLNVSATQELARRLVAAEERVAELESLRGRVEQLSSALEEMEVVQGRLEVLERALELLVPVAVGGD